MSASRNQSSCGPAHVALAVSYAGLIAERYGLLPTPPACSRASPFGEMFNNALHYKLMTADLSRDHAVRSNEILGA
jgi:hypothetical protein